MFVIDNRVTKICANCGKAFTTKFPDKIYCKKFCGQQAAERKHRKHPPLEQLMFEAKICGLSFKRYTAELRNGKTFDDLRRIHCES